MKNKYPGRTLVISRDDARDILWKAKLAEGQPVNPDYQCRNPMPIYAIGLPSMFEKNTGKLPVELSARCRKCEGCLAHRRRLWTARAVDEIDVSQRTWFGTLTVCPAERFKMRVRADLNCHNSGTPWSSLDTAEQFKALAAELNKEATRALKRLRKVTGRSFRYLLVTEKHKSGDPHLHILIHEQSGAISKRQLEACWRYGFSKWKLVDRDRGAAVYVCKYLAKDALTRVRASLKYGQPTKVRLVTKAAESVALAHSTT